MSVSDSYMSYFQNFLGEHAPDPLRSPKNFCCASVTIQAGSALELFYLSVVAGPLKTFGEENDLPQLGKMQFVVDATSRNLQGKPMTLLSTICFHLYFHPVVQNFQKNDSFAGAHPSLG